MLYFQTSEESWLGLLHEKDRKALGAERNGSSFRALTVSRSYKERD